MGTSNNNSCVTPDSIDGSNTSIKSFSAPSKLYCESDVFSRPILRSISNLSTSEKKGHSSQKSSKDKINLKVISKDKLAIKDQPEFELHPLDNVVMSAKVNSVSPQTPLSKFLTKKTFSMTNSPLASNQLKVQEENFMALSRESSQLSLEKDILKHQLKNLTQNGIV